MLEVLSARTDFCYLARDNTDLKTCREQSVVIINTLGRSNDVAELVFDMMLNSESGRMCALCTVPS